MTTGGLHLFFIFIKVHLKLLTIWQNCKLQIKQCLTKKRGNKQHIITTDIQAMMRQDALFIHVNYVTMYLLSSCMVEYEQYFL